MNNIFDIKRFGNYLAYDLRRAGNNYGISLLVLGLMPVILFIFHILTCLLRWGTVNSMSAEFKIIVFSTVLFVTAVLAGVKIYGSITDKRTGSDFLMLPASTFEKWLSMVLMVCVVVPVALLAISIVSDTLLSWIFPAYYGDGAIAGVCGDAFNDFINSEDAFFNIPAILFLGWCGSALTFTLGGIYFKKAKIAKTFLSLFALGTLIMIIATFIVGSLDINTEQLSNVFENVNDPNSAINAFNWMLNIYFFITRGLLLVLIWLRIRTLKH